MKSLRYARLGVIVVLAFLSVRTSVFLLTHLNTNDETLSPNKIHIVPSTDLLISRPNTEAKIIQHAEKASPTTKPSFNNNNNNNKSTTEDHGDDIGGVWQHLRSEFRCSKPVLRPKPTQVHTRNTHWQLYDLAGRRNHLLVYSAFFDDRAEAGFLPFIRILGVVNKDHDSLYCQLWFEGMDVPYIVAVIITTSGRGDHFDGITYGQHLYSCKLPSAYPRPTHVSMTSKPCETSSVFLPITWPIRTSWQRDFAICVPIAFGNFDALDLVEWFEMVKLMGVTHVHVYNASMSTQLNKVLNYYEKSGVLKVHAMPPPVAHFDKRGSKLASPASLNDCMLRYMYAYRYIIFIDFDELILPQNAANYSSMLGEIDRHHKLSKSWISYTFRNVYHFLDIQGDPEEKDFMKFLKYRSGAPPSGFLYAAKSMVDPRHCLSVFNHYCYVRFPTASKPFTIDVDAKLAKSHHYRKCNLNKVKCKELYAKSKVDPTILKYKDVLKTKVDAVIPSVT